MVIVTHPHVDERDNRQWKADNCPLGRACIQGNRESMIPDICGRYVNRMKEQSVERVEECHSEDLSC